MAGFLLEQDAVDARKSVFDNWIDEQKRAAEQAAQAVQARVQQDASQVAARAQQFQEWVQQQQAALAPPPPQQQPTTGATLPASSAPTAPAPVVGEAPAEDGVAARARQFQDWITQQSQQLAAPPTVPPVPTERSMQAPALPPEEEPATPSDALGSKWKTSFDHGATYTGSYRTGTPHRGIDLVPHKGSIGTAVEAFAPGTVTNISRDSGAGGLMVYVQDDDGLTHAYMHLQGAAPGLQVGQRVGRGQRIATMGESGTEGSPHLHYEVRRNAATGDPLDKLIDPRPYIAGQGLPPSRFNPAGKSTAELSGGGPSGAMNERAQSIMSEAGQAAAAFGGDAARAVQAVLVTEGGLNNARGDRGASAGPLQFFGEEGGRAGQLNNFARDLGVPLEDARKWIEQNPVAAVKWALGTPDLPGYLGRALIDGIQKGFQGSALAEHIQRVGQVSVSPERAAANYQSLFGQGQEAVRRAGTGAMDAALEAGRQVEGRAGELVREGQQLAQQGQGALSQLEQMQAQARAEGERWFSEQRARGEEWDARRQRQDLDWQRSLSDQMAQFQENARGFTAPLMQGAETARDFLSGDMAARNRQQPFSEAFQQRAAEVAEQRPLVPQNLEEGAGAFFRGAPGTAMGGTLTIPEWQELEERRRRDVSGFVRENVPGGDLPFVGGALQMAGEELTSPANIVLSAPLLSLGRGVALLAGGGVRGAIADWAVQGGIFSAISAASRPGALPEDVGEAFLTGAGLGGGIRGAAAGAGLVGRRLLNAPELQRFMRSESGELDIDRVLGLGRPEEPPLPPTRRMFHGTASEFDTPEAGRFAEEGLFGPGYYLTSDPRVAGGVVERAPDVRLADARRNLEAARSRLASMEDPSWTPASEGIPREEWLRSQQRDIALRESDLINLESGSHPLASGYAQHRTTEFTQAGADQLAELERRIDIAKATLAGNPSPELRAFVARDLADAEARYARLVPKAGPNVRAVDVPEGLNLLDADAVAGDAVLSVTDALKRVYGPRSGRLDLFDNFIADTPDPTGENVYRALQRSLTETHQSPNAANAEVNRVLRVAGFDGIRYSGGQRTPMRDAAGRDIQHEATVIFPEALPKIRNAISGRQGGFAAAPFAARLGGAAAGGYAGFESTPEEAGLPERIARTAVGASAGFAAPGVAQAALTRPQLRQQTLEQLRRGGIAPGSPMPSRAPGLNTSTGVDVTKQLILSDPVSRVMDLVGNTIELLRQPIALTMGGQGPEAAAGTAAIMRGLPEAFQNAVQAIQGRQVATLGQGAQDIGRSKPIFRLLAAGDVFTRTLGEYQGMASRAIAMLNKAGLTPGTPQADQYLTQHADELYREGVRSGTGSVFGSAQRGANASPLDQLMSKLSDAKEGLLNSPRKLDQALGALLDLNIPFSGTPSRVLQIGLQRVPGITQAAGAARIMKALQKGDTFAAQKALGEVTTETLIQLRIAQGISDGHITGPDDPEHPSSIQINGQWVPLRTLGVYGMPAGIMAAFAESVEKTGREPDPDVKERFAAALNASMEPLLDAVPGFSMMNTLAAVGRGGLTGALEKQASDAIARLTSPALLAKAENMLDPYVRDVHKRGWESLWEPTFAKNPIAARFLPPKIDPTTGEPMARGVTILGGAARPSGPIRAELARLKREGYDINPPTDKPSSITIRGVSVPVQDGSPEQRAMVAARGKFLAEVGDQMTKPTYAKMTDDQKAKFWSRMIDRSARQQTRAWNDSVDPERAARILARGKRVVGRLQDVDDETELINRQVAIMSQLRRQQQRSA